METRSSIKTRKEKLSYFENGITGTESWEALFNIILFSRFFQCKSKNLAGNETSQFPGGEKCCRKLKFPRKKVRFLSFRPFNILVYQGQGIVFFIQSALGGYLLCYEQLQVLGLLSLVSGAIPTTPHPPPTLPCPTEQSIVEV